MVNIRNEIKEAFEVRANEIGFCLDQRWGQYENPYINNDTALAYNLFKDGWIAANNIRDEELNGCVVVPVENLNKAIDAFESIFRDDPTLALGELLPIQQDIKAMVEAARENNHE
ncbi:hypothetical protein [Acinetobacter modestus]|uniref:hypothetical protein n=1 Tax=Acinetobacter modestus TaxID=1776740 RepID=UPI001F4B76A8|nr:hypothetical protein [Acinetobacter modestus]MCH7330563.1 hypothetical protein [Acinetobacter modestus]